MIEKREHVRVETALPVRYKVLSDEAYEEARKRIMLQPAAAWCGQEPTSALGLDLDSLAEAPAFDAEGVDPALAAVLGVLDRKLNLILRLLVENRRTGLAEEPTFPVNLSGGGLMMTIPDPLERGKKLEMEITLATFLPVRIAAIGEIVRVVPSEGHGEIGLYDAAIKFVDIKEDDRETVIRYVFQRQRHALRNVAAAG
ncbi:MAG: PilZ domain-containing protein [bacterium]|nr:PilZ domain-containing protein [bacterium]